MQNNTMRRTIIPLLAILSFFLGCAEPTAHYNRTKVLAFEKPLTKKPYGTVKLIQSQTPYGAVQSEVTGKYEVLALMTVEGNAGEEAAFIKAFLYRAADLGADALILYRGDVVGGQQGMAVAAKNGAFGFTSPSQDAVYRGEAIHFK
jgi:hypothetical protein